MWFEYKEDRETLKTETEIKEKYHKSFLRLCFIENKDD